MNQSRTILVVAAAPEARGLWLAAVIDPITQTATPLNAGGQGWEMTQDGARRALEACDPEYDSMLDALNDAARQLRDPSHGCWMETRFALEGLDRLGIDVQRARL